MNLTIYLVGGFLLGGIVGYVVGGNKHGCLIACVVPLTFFVVGNIEFSMIDPDLLNSTASLAIFFYTAYACVTGAIGYVLGQWFRAKRS